MKKVRYALGVAGITPALGMMIPTVGLNPVQPAAKAKPAKTVSLRGREAPLVGCTGGTNYFANLAGRGWGFWYTRHGAKTCIGTVSGVDSVRSDTSWRIRVYEGTGKTRVVNKTQNTSVSHYGVHQSLTDPVQVCVAFMDHGTIGWNPCHSVG